MKTIFRLFFGMTMLGTAFSGSALAQLPILNFVQTDGDVGSLAPGEGLLEGRLYLIELTCKPRHAGTKRSIASLLATHRTAEGAQIRTYVESLAVSLVEGSETILAEIGKTGRTNVTISAGDDGLPGLTRSGVTVPVGLTPTLFYSEEDGQQSLDLTDELCGTAFFAEVSATAQPTVSVQVYASPQQSTQFQSVVQNGAIFLTSVIEILSGAAAGPEVPPAEDVTTATNALQSIYGEFKGTDLTHETRRLRTGVNQFNTTLMTYNFLVYPADIDTGNGFLRGPAPMSSHWGLWLKDTEQKALAETFRASAQARLLGSSADEPTDACSQFLDSLVKKNLAPIDIAFIASATLGSVPASSVSDLDACNRPQIICHGLNFPLGSAGVANAIPTRMRLDPAVWADECAPYLQADPSDQEALLRAIALRRDAEAQAAQEEQDLANIRQNFEDHAAQTDFSALPLGVAGFSDLGPRFQDSILNNISAALGQTVTVQMESSVLAGLDGRLSGLLKAMQSGSSDEDNAITERRQQLRQLYEDSFAQAERWASTGGLFARDIDSGTLFRLLVEAGYKRFACQVNFDLNYFESTAENKAVQTVLGLDAPTDPSAWWHSGFLLFQAEDQTARLSLENAIIVRARRSGTAADPGPVLFEIRAPTSASGLVRELRMAAGNAKACSTVPLSDPA